MSYLSEVRTVFRHAFRLQSTRLSVANYSKSSAPPKDDEVYNEDEQGNVNVSELLVDEVDLEAREKKIERMRNKSRLNKTHRNFLFNKPKPLEEYIWDQTIAFNRKQYGRFGSASGVDPRICFYTPTERADKQEYERVAYPFTIQEMVEINKREKAEKAAKILEREAKIAANMGKLDKWMADLNQRIAKKEEETRLARQKRERLLEDIRQEIGFKIDFKDPRFKALMEQKELEAKKEKKAEKKKKREEQLLEKLKEQAQATLQQSKAKEDDVEDGDSEKQPQPKAKSKDKSTKSKDEDSDASDSDSDDEKKVQPKKKKWRN